MKTEMSSLDIAFAVREMQIASGARFEKAFQEGNQLHVALHLPGKGSRTLVAGEGMFFLSERTPPHAEVPTNFAMYLRKHLKGMRVKAIEQAGFDRIVSIDFGEFRLIFELFREGNSLFVSGAGEIYSALRREEWKGRILGRGERYTPPPASSDTSKISEGEFLSLLANQKQIVAFLAREMSLGGTYAEEACIRAGIEKTKACDKLGGEEGKKIFLAIKSLLSESAAPSIILENKIYADVVPFRLKRYEGTESKQFESFNGALEEYFLHEISSKKETAEKKEAGAKKAKLAQRQKEQEDAILRMEEEEKKLVTIAGIIKSRYSELDAVLLAARQAGLKNALSASPKIKKTDEKKKTILVDAGEGNNLMLNVNKSLAENAGEYYTQAKKMREKVSRARAALEKTKSLVVAEEAPKKFIEKAALKEQKKEWYHNFRWFISSSGFVVVGGRDAATNEIIVKKHTEKGDLVFHTEIAGSPFVVVKSGGRQIDKKTIEEAAQFAACHSRAWKQGVGSLDVFYVPPEQVTKKTPSGEYVGHGSFMVYGDKKWIKTELRLAAGLVDGRFVTGPVASVSAKTGKYVLIGPGTTPATEIAKRIKAEIFSVSSKAEQEMLRKLGTEEIQKEIPFGSGEILRAR